MATVLEECATEEQRSVVRVFCGQKDSMQMIFIMKCFLFAMGSVCHVKRFTPGWQTFRWWRRGWNGGAEVARTTVKRILCFGFRLTDKAMGQVDQCRWRICRAINVFFFPGSNMTRFTFYIRLWPIYWLSLAWPLEFVILIMRHRIVYLLTASLNKPRCCTHQVIR
jgi:hypothetical protein